MFFSRLLYSTPSFPAPLNQSSSNTPTPHSFFIPPLLLAQLITIIILITVLHLQLEPGVPLPSPSSLKRKIIIKNKKKHRTHYHQRVNTQSSHSQFHVELNQTREQRPLEMQGNGEIPRPIMEKEGSRESSEEENEVANGECAYGCPGYDGGLDCV